MRTYARKRTEYQVIEGVHEMCRLCLEKVTESVPIFSDNDNVCDSLTMRIMMCVGLEVIVYYFNLYFSYCPLYNFTEYYLQIKH